MAEQQQEGQQCQRAAACDFQLLEPVMKVGFVGWWPVVVAGGWMVVADNEGQPPQGCVLFQQ